MSSEVIAQSVSNGLMSASIYILVAMGLALVLSIMGMLQMAHGEFYMLGGYGAYFFCVVLGLNFLLSLIIATVVIGCFGILIERLFFKPFRGGQFFRSVIIVTGLSLILQAAVAVSWGRSSKVVVSPFTGVIEFAGISISVERIVVIVVAVVFITALFILVNKTKIGQAMIAVSQSVQAAALQGVNVDRVSAFCMFLGCALAAVAGALMGSIFGLDPYMGTSVLMKGIAVIILGGLGSIPGVVFGGLILGLVDGIVPTLASVQIASIVGFLVIIVILLFRPQGISGHASQ